jgi:hypothetical protein
MQMQTGIQAVQMEAGLGARTEIVDSGQRDTRPDFLFDDP